MNTIPMSNYEIALTLRLDGRATLTVTGPRPVVETIAEELAKSCYPPPLTPPVAGAPDVSSPHSTPQILSPEEFALVRRHRSEAAVRTQEAITSAAVGQAMAEKARLEQMYWGQKE